MNTNTNPPQFLAQAAWHLVKEFAGIYNNSYMYHKFPQYELSVLLRAAPLEFGFTHPIHTLKEGVRPTHLFHPDQGVLKPVPRHYLNEMSYAYFKLMHPHYVTGAAPKRVPRDWNSKKVGGVNTGIDIGLTWLASDKWIDWDGVWWSPSQIDNGTITQKLPPIGFKTYNTERVLWNFLEECIETAAIQNSVQAIPLVKANLFKVIARHPSRHAIYKELDRLHKGERRRCLCGSNVPTNSKSALTRHLKTSRHCKNVTYKSNLHTIAKWHRHTGFIPVGFEQTSILPFTSINTLSHIIPADSKRTAKHWVSKALLKPSESVDLVELMRKDTNGRGWWREHGPGS